LHSENATALVIKSFTRCKKTIKLRHVKKKYALRCASFCALRFRRMLS
jgi:hypothetical protein